MAKRRRIERHTALIDSLAAVLFPHQESEEEQESFTDVGRQRVDEWIERVLAEHGLNDDEPFEPPTANNEVV